MKRIQRLQIHESRRIIPKSVPKTEEMAQEIKIKKLTAPWETRLDTEMPERGGKFRWKFKSCEENISLYSRLLMPINLE